MALKYLSGCACVSLCNLTTTDKASGGVERVLVALFESQTSSNTLSDKEIEPLIECLPIPLLFDELLARTQTDIIPSLTEALKHATETYCDCLTKAVRKNNHSTTGFWEAFARRC